MDGRASIVSGERGVGPARGRRLRRRLVVAAVPVALVLAVLAPLRSQDAPAPPPRHPVDARLDACLAKDPSTQGMLACLDAAYAEWDAELNRAYRELLSRLTAGEAESLREAQRAWLAHRDATFKLFDAVYGRKEGTMFLTMRAADRVDVVRKRALELLSVLDLLEIE